MSADLHAVGPGARPPEYRAVRIGYRPWVRNRAYGRRDWTRSATACLASWSACCDRLHLCRGLQTVSAPALEHIRKMARGDLAAVPYFQGVMSGETDALVRSFAGEPELHHPVRGR